MLAAAAPQRLAAPRQHSCLTRRSVVSVCRQLAAPAAPRCAAGSGGARGSSQDTAQPPLAVAARLAHACSTTTVAAAAAALLLLGPAALPLPAAAELSTISAQQATEMAKPLKQQKVDKGRIWLLFVLGATSLFGTTVVLENNEKWFPAISRANRAMKAAQARMAQREEEVAAEQAAFEARLAAVQQERATDAAVDAAVLEGLQQARQRSSSGSSVEGEGQQASGSVAAAAAAPAAVAAAAAATEVAATEAAAVEAPPSSVAFPAAPAADSSSAAAAISSSANGSSEASSGGAAAAPAAEAAPAEGGAQQQAEQEGEQGERKPLFEISAAQIEASSTERMKQLQAEVERRQAAPAGSAPPEA